MSQVVVDAERLVTVGRRNEAVALVRQAAAKRDPDALLQEALWLLGSEVLPLNPSLARERLSAAADAGQRDAALIELVLQANGSGGPPDWEGARAKLNDLAAQGDEVAVAHCSLIARMDLSRDGTPRQPYQSTLLSTQPRIVSIARFVTPAECEHIASLALDRLRPATVVDPVTGRMMPHRVRTSYEAALTPLYESLVVQAINRRIAAVTETRWQQGEALTVLRYAPGQEFRPHLDAIAGARNQRVTTALIYLNDGYEGGETRFVGGVSVRPRAGDALIFDNVDARGRADPNSQHAGTVITRGTKWVATRWIRALPFDPWLGPDSV